MRILGVDPGVRHTGIVVLEDGAVRHRETLVLPGYGNVPIVEALAPILGALKRILLEYGQRLDKASRIDVACVEQVGWYGRAKRITLPLSHIAGAITAYLVAFGIPTYLLYARQKRAKFKFLRRKGEPLWDDHQRDAAMLAQVAYLYERAKADEDAAYLRRFEGVGKHYLAIP